MDSSSWKTPTATTVLYAGSSVLGTAGVGVILASSDARQGLMPHAYCLAASPYLALVRGTVDISIWLAYFAMAIVLLNIYRARSKFAMVGNFSEEDHRKSYSLILWFAAFIFSCGTTHLFNFITLYRAYYYLDTLWMCTTSATSWGTVYLVVKNRRKVAKMLEVLKGENNNQRLED